MEAKTKKLCGFIFLALVAVGLVLAIVGMFTGVVTTTALGESESTGLFNEMWGEMGAPSNTFAVIAFIVTLIGAVVLLVDAILRVFVGKDLKIVRIIGVALAFVGAILVLVAGIMLASDLNKIVELATLGLGSVSAGVGVWLGFIGGLVAAIAGGLPLLKAFN